MKELSIEEKAKRFDEALEKARRYYDEYKTRDNILYVEDMEDMFPELKESEDEKIRKALLEMVHDTTGDSLWVDYNIHKEDAIAWLEKQDEHANFINKIQIGDKVTRNEDGVLVNLSQLKRVAKKDEKQGEQKPAWSEEDDQYLLVCKNALAKYQVSDKWDAIIISRWLEDKLKSLRPQSHWKPSDEQMDKK